MALRIENTLVILRRRDLPRWPGLAPLAATLQAEGGFIGEQCWYDAQLFAESTSTDPQAVLKRWAAASLWARLFGRLPEGAIVLSPGENTHVEWLDGDAESVWLKNEARGTIIGGRAQREEEEQRLQKLEALAESRYDAMYDSNYPKDDYEDAAQALHEAVNIAKFLHRSDDATRLNARATHIREVYNSQFRYAGRWR